MRVPIIIEPSLPSPTDSLVYTKLRSARSRRAGAHHPDGAGRRVLHHQHPWRGVWRAQSKGSPGAHCGLGSDEAGGGLPRSWRATMTPEMEATYAPTRESASVRLPSSDTREYCAAQVLVDTGREQKAGGSWCGTAGCPPQRGAERERERSADEREAQGHQRRDDEGRCGAAHPAAVWLHS